jgi:Protein of unknown function (DUF2867)
VAQIDRFLPAWDEHEVHAVVVSASPEDALAAALAAPSAPDVVRVLLRLRGLRASGSIEELFRWLGFEELAREADEVVVGGSGTPWRVRARIGAFDEAGPGTVRVAANFRVEPLPDGRTRLSTETRIAAVDADARRAFRRYWRLIGPFSALIRRRWLAATRRSLAA